jgi:hypothetical protein
MLAKANVTYSRFDGEVSCQTRTKTVAVREHSLCQTKAILDAFSYFPKYLRGKLFVADRASKDHSTHQRGC